MSSCERKRRLANCRREKSGFWRDGRLAYVEAVELRNPVLGDELRDGGIALREPSEELGNTAQPVSTLVGRQIARKASGNTHPMLATRRKVALLSSQLRRFVGRFSWGWLIRTPLAPTKRAGCCVCLPALNKNGRAFGNSKLEGLQHLQQLQARGAKEREKHSKTRFQVPLLEARQCASGLSCRLYVVNSEDKNEDGKQRSFAKRRRQEWGC